MFLAKHQNSLDARLVVHTLGRDEGRALGRLERKDEERLGRKNANKKNKKNEGELINNI